MGQDVTGMDEARVYLSEYTMEVLERIAVALELLVEALVPTDVGGPQ